MNIGKVMRGVNMKDILLGGSLQSLDLRGVLSLIEEGTRRLKGNRRTGHQAKDRQRRRKDYRSWQGTRRLKRGRNSIVGGKGEKRD